MTLTADPSVQAEDVLPVKSRITWSAILAGAVLSLALYFLFTLLGGAVGLSMSDRVSSRAMGNGALVFAILVTAVALFFGGYLASLFTVGENPREGALYGILVWATVMAALMCLMAGGVRTGYAAVVGTAAVAENTSQDQWEDLARRAGVPQEKLDEWKQRANNAPAAARQAADDPETRRQVTEGATRAAWFSFAGAWLSMLIAALGGYVGSGANIRLLGLGRPGATTTATVVRVAPA